MTRRRLKAQPLSVALAELERADPAVRKASEALDAAQASILAIAKAERAVVKAAERWAKTPQIVDGFTVQERALVRALDRLTAARKVGT